MSYTGERTFRAYHVYEFTRTHGERLVREMEVDTLEPGNTQEVARRRAASKFGGPRDDWSVRYTCTRHKSEAEHLHHMGNNP